MSDVLTDAIHAVHMRAKARQLVEVAIAGLTPHDAVAVLAEVAVQVGRPRVAPQAGETGPSKQARTKRPMHAKKARRGDVSALLLADIKARPKGDIASRAQAVYGASDTPARKRIHTLIAGLVRRGALVKRKGVLIVT